jgi:hypothetical protein
MPLSSTACGCPVFFQPPRPARAGELYRLPNFFTDSQKKSIQEEIEKTLGYFETNKERMRYAEFRKQGLFVGSGVIEAGCKMIVAQRLKQSGMRWTVRGANAIIALRCCQISGRWEEFWENRMAQ